MTFTVRTLPRATADVQRIFDWISERSPDGARRWLGEFLDACARLKQHPDQYALAPETEGCGREIRQVLFKTRRGALYRALYTIVGNEVRIVRVRGPGQPDLLPDELV